MSYLLPHLRSGWAVDQSILAEEVFSLQAGLEGNAGAEAARQDRVVVLRFGHDYDETCMQMDEARPAAHFAERGLTVARRRLPPSRKR